MLILGMVMVSMVSVGADPQLTRLFVDPPTYTATRLSEVFTINISVTNVTDLCILKFKLGYNTTLLDALDAVKGPFFPPPDLGLTNITIHESEGYVDVSVQCLPASGNGTVATITFNATYAWSASCTLHLYDTVLTGFLGPIDHDVEDGNYKFVILGVTVATDKPSYLLGENIEIHGNLTLDGSPHQGFVVLEVDDPNNRVIVIRTLQTGPTPPPPPGNITIVDVVPCNNWGQPKDSFAKGQLAYFIVTFRNNGTELKNVTITINAFDSNMVPLPNVPSTRFPIAPGSQSDFLAGIYIPDWAEAGTGKVYACALTLMSCQGGVPYCPEKSATFQITGSGGGAGAPGAQGSENVGNYSLTFKLSRFGAKVGNYTVYASSSYLRRQVVNTTTFKAEVLGDVNGDGIVNVIDILLCCLNMGPVPPSPPECDINDDGTVNVLDIVLCCLNMG